MYEILVKQHPLPGTMPGCCPTSREIEAVILGVSYWMLFNILNKGDKLFSIINNPDMSNVLAMANVTNDSYECTLVQT